MGKREEDVVMAVEDEWEEEEEEEEEVMEKEVARWKELLPRVPVRVLLVEGDDSTRQIIAALLRKCSYKVAAASDGLKAWDALKDKPRSIDLVLTEVELPSVSGFSLLNMIMDHDTCKNIPVIMMSSHDSMSVIFKCMLKGAADFLVKPVRKNELRNLWQHVWRRQLASHGNDDNHGLQDENDIRHHLNANTLCRDLVPSVKETNECSEQGSDAQSSCTRSDVEADCAEKQNLVSLKLTKTRKQNPEDDILIQEGKEHLQLQSVPPVAHQSKAKVTSEGMLSAKALTNNNINGANDTQKTDKEKASKEVDLIHVMDNQGQLKEAPLGDVTSANGFSGINDSSQHRNMSDVPHLELCLRSCEESICKRPENEELNSLNHSNSSAFSRYANKKVVPILSKPINLSSRRQEDQEGKEVQCNPIQVIPFSLPDGGTPLDGAYAPMMQPLFYQQPGHPIWSTFPTIWHETTQGNIRDQSKTGQIDSIQGNHLDDCNSRCLSNHSAEKQDEPVEPSNEQKHVTNVEGESASSSICNVDRVQPNSSNCASICHGNSWNIDPSSVYISSAEYGHDVHMFTHEGNKPTDVHRLSQREAALNKFRLKRKERCFEKKVRYESRKLLAEQRPRVKGQFVRKTQSDSPTTPSGCSFRNFE